jgi:hypothetical protein
MQQTLNLTMRHERRSKKGSTADAVGAAWLCGRCCPSIAKGWVWLAKARIDKKRLPMPVASNALNGAYGHFRRPPRLPSITVKDHRVH